jgi:glutamine synthetase
LTAETVGDAHSQHPAALAISWQEAVAQVSRSRIAKDYFGEQFTHCFDRIKNAELNRFGCTITDFEYNSYLRHV